MAGIPALWNHAPAITRRSKRKTGSVGMDTAIKGFVVFFDILFYVLLLVPRSYVAAVECEKYGRRVPYAIGDQARRVALWATGGIEGRVSRGVQ